MIFHNHPEICENIQMEEPCGLPFASKWMTHPQNYSSPSRSGGGGVGIYSVFQTDRKTTRAFPAVGALADNIVIL